MWYFYFSASVVLVLRGGFFRFFSLVPVWQDCWIICLIFGHLQHWKCAQKYIEYANASQKVCQILNKLFQNGQSFLTLCHFGEISPNLVTLFST